MRRNYGISNKFIRKTSDLESKVDELIDIVKTSLKYINLSYKVI